ncbi:hypothetical protein HDE_07916 [Halotydeus destructor]|nr:hypothetical protein HDE_07916 [Halotydeus destructor]
MAAQKKKVYYPIVKPQKVHKIEWVAHSSSVAAKSLLHIDGFKFHRYRDVSHDDRGIEWFVCANSTSKQRPHCRIKAGLYNGDLVSLSSDQHCHDRSGVMTKKSQSRRHLDSDRPPSFTQLDLSPNMALPPFSPIPPRVTRSTAGDGDTGDEPRVEVKVLELEIKLDGKRTRVNIDDLAKMMAENEKVAELKQQVKHQNETLKRQQGELEQLRAELKSRNETISKFVERDVNHFRR